MSRKVPETIPMKESYLNNYAENHFRIHVEDPYNRFDPVVVIKGKTYKPWSFNISKEPTHDFEVIEYLWDAPKEHWKDPTPTIVHKFSRDDLLGATIKLTKAKKWNAFVDDIEVGDFVQFSGQRDSKSWRKIIRIDYDRYEVFGFKYSKPIDDEEYDQRYSSSNSIWFIKKLIKAKDAVA